MFKYLAIERDLYTESAKGRVSEQPMKHYCVQLKGWKSRCGSCWWKTSTGIRTGEINCVHASRNHSHGFIEQDWLYGAYSPVVRTCAVIDDIFWNNDFTTAIKISLLFPRTSIIKSRIFPRNYA